MDTKRQLEPSYLRQRGLYWRSVGALLVFQAVGWGLAAVLAYAIISPELAKDYFSAHSTVKAAWQLVIPALALSAAAGFLAVGLGSAWSVWSHSRRLLEPLRRMDALVRELGVGRFPLPDPSATGQTADEQVATALAPLHGRVQTLRRLSRNIQKISLELNYRSAGTVEVTLKDLRALAAQLDALSKDLAATSDWFEG